MTTESRPPSPAELVANAKPPDGRRVTGMANFGGRRGQHRRLANAVAAERTRLGLSRDAVEKAAGVRGLKAIEDGKNVNLRSAVLLARFFGLPVEALWTVPAEVPGA